MDKLFKLSLRGTDKKTEIIAGLTTFMTMAYVLAVQPAAICGGEAYITDVNGVVITKSAITSQHCSEILNGAPLRNCHLSANFIVGQYWPARL